MVEHYCENPLPLVIVFCMDTKDAVEVKRNLMSLLGTKMGVSRRGEIIHDEVRYKFVPARGMHDGLRCNAFGFSEKFNVCGSWKRKEETRYAGERACVSDYKYEGKSLFKIL